jgi:hypothetical protein
VICRVFLSVILLFAIASISAANPPRFVARFASGSFVEGNTLSDWHSPEAIPKIENQALFDPANPLRWLIDRSQSPSPPMPDSFVEMVTGDRLPGSVIDFRIGDESLYSPLPAHFLVRYEGPTPGTLERQSTVLRIDARSVRRIVWLRRKQDLWQPRTAFLRDGSFVKFRSIRWAPGAVSLLLESGPRRLAMNELAEIDLAPMDYWSNYFDELAALSPDGQRRLLQCETTEGLVATTSLDRMQPRALGDVKDINRWILGIQPAWSLDVVWLWQGTVWARRSFAPHEVPLIRITPVRVEQRSPLGTFKPAWMVNHNFQGGPLRATNRESGWGFGVQAFSELEFEFPAAARTLRSEFAIDAEMKNGGCVQPRVINASAGNAAIYQGPVVVGSESILDTGPLGINGSGDQPRRVVLQVDPVLANRPPNADPLDIRDQANWLDPVLELDPAIVKQQVETRSIQQNLAWRGWTVVNEPGSQIQHANYFAEAPGNVGEYRLGAVVTGSAIKLTKTHMLDDLDRWLVVDAVRTQPPGPPCKLSVKLGSGMPVEWDVPVYDKTRSDFRPLILSLAESRKTPPTPLEIELRALAATERVPILWRAIAIVHQHPMFFRLLEDGTAAEGPSSPPRADGGQWDDQQKHTGNQSLRLPAAREFRIPVTKPIAIRERPQLGEYRFLRFAVRKQGGGGLKVAMEHAATVDRPANYEAGANPPDDPTVKRISNQALPNNWQLVTRDLFGDFGNLDLTGLSFQFVGGKEGWLDHVYLARTQSDYDLIKGALPH